MDYNNIKKYFNNYPYYKDMDIIYIDLNKIPTRLIQKLLSIFPRYNPYKHPIGTSSKTKEVAQIYLKQTAFKKEYTSIIPYTNANRDSDFQTVCLLTPFY